MARRRRRNRNRHREGRSGAAILVAPESAEVESPDTLQVASAQEARDHDVQGQVQAQEVQDPATEEVDSVNDAWAPPGTPTVTSTVAPAPEPTGGPVAQALHLTAQGQHQEAAARLRPLVSAQDTPDLGVLIALAQVLCNMGAFPEAQEMVDLALARDPSDVEVQYAQGHTLFRRGLYREAETVLSSVCHRDEDHADAHYYRGEALNRVGRSAEAADVLERAVALKPDNPRALRTLGHLYDRLQRQDRAAEMFRKARQITER